MRGTMWAVPNALGRLFRFRPVPLMPKRQPAFVGMILCLALLSIPGCDTPTSPSLRDAEPAMVGPVLHLFRDDYGGHGPGVHVRGEYIEEEGIHDEAFFMVGASTEIARRTDSGFRTLSLDDLESGDSVAVWGSVVLLPDPPIGSASAIEVLSK